MFKNLAYILFYVSLSLPAYGLNFHDTDNHGQVHHLSDYQGKWVVLNYWAVWCSPCRKEMPELERLHRYQNHHFVVLGVYADRGDREEINEFLQENGITYPTLMGYPMTMNAIESVQHVPTTFLINPRGEVVAKEIGEVSADMIINFIRSPH